MPATCFNRLPLGAGAIAQRCRLSLQGLSEAWLRYGVRPALRSDLCALVGYKCNLQAYAHAAGVGVLHCAALESLLVSNTTLADYIGKN